MVSARGYRCPFPDCAWRLAATDQMCVRAHRARMLGRPLDASARVSAFVTTILAPQIASVHTVHSYTRTHHTTAGINNNLQRHDRVRWPPQICRCNSAPGRYSVQLVCVYLMACNHEARSLENCASAKSRAHTTPNHTHTYVRMAAGCEKYANTCWCFGCWPPPLSVVGFSQEKQQQHSTLLAAYATGCSQCAQSPITVRRAKDICDARAIVDWTLRTVNHITGKYDYLLAFVVVVVVI